MQKPPVTAYERSTDSRARNHASKHVMEAVVCPAQRGAFLITLTRPNCGRNSPSLAKSERSRLFLFGVAVSIAMHSGESIVMFENGSI